MRLIIAIMLYSSTALSNTAIVLEEGQLAPFKGVLMEPETALLVVERAQAYDATYAALVSQNDMLIEAQKQKIALEFEKQSIQRKSDNKNKWIVFLSILLVAAAAK